MALGMGRRFALSGAFLVCAIALPTVASAEVAGKVLSVVPIRIQNPGKKKQDWMTDADEIRFKGEVVHGDKAPDSKEFLVMSEDTKLKPEQTSEIDGASPLIVPRDSSVWIHLEEGDKVMNDGANTKFMLPKDFVNHIYDAVAALDSTNSAHTTPYQMDLKFIYQVDLWADAKGWLEHELVQEFTCIDLADICDKFIPPPYPNCGTVMNTLAVAQGVADAGAMMGREEAQKVSAAISIVQDVTEVCASEVFEWLQDKQIGSLAETVTYVATFRLSMESLIEECPGGVRVFNRYGWPSRRTAACNSLCDSYTNAVCHIGQCVCREGWRMAKVRVGDSVFEVCVLCEAPQCSGGSSGGETTGGTCELWRCDESRGAECVQVGHLWGYHDAPKGHSEARCQCPFGKYARDGKCDACDLEVITELKDLDPATVVVASGARRDVYSSTLLGALSAMAAQIAM